MSAIHVHLPLPAAPPPWSRRQDTTQPLPPRSRRRVRAFTDRNAQAIAELQRRGHADPSLDPQLTAEALSAMVGRVAYYRYVHRFNSASIESLTQTLTALWAGALGLTARAGGKSHPPKPRRSPR
jgi:hypothetical protein